MKNTLWYKIFLVASFVSLTLQCTSAKEDVSSEKEDATRVEETLIVVPDDHKQSKQLNVLIQNSANSLFIYKGDNYGLEYELLQLFAKHKGYNVNYDFVRNAATSKEQMYQDKYHIAVGTFIEPIDDSLDHIAFTKPLYYTKPCLVFNKNRKKIDTSDVVTFYVLKDSYLIDYLSIKYYAIDEEHVKSKQDLVNNILECDSCISLIDANEAYVANAFHRNEVDVMELEGARAPVGFVVNKHAEGLEEELNHWILKNRNTSDFQWIIKKYQRVPSEIDRLLRIHSPTLNRHFVSAYDKEIKKHAEKINWDWLMVCALIHQESRFNPHLKSWVGAVGLMQVMPNVAWAYAKVKPADLYKPALNIKAGTVYLKWISDHFFTDIENEEERVKFVLASYNVGVGHVSDARALAKKYNKNPNVWTDEVEQMMLLKSKRKYYQDKVCKHGYCRGREPVTYVNNIMTYYDLYKKY